jgi:peptide methionine sulfoxide reductase MsrA
VVDQLSIAARQADGDRQAALEQSKSWQEQAQQGERRLTEIQLQKAQLQAECEHVQFKRKNYFFLPGS